MTNSFPSVKILHMTLPTVKYLHPRELPRDIGLASYISFNHGPYVRYSAPQPPNY